MDTTPILGLPLLATQQAQAEILHNEALILIQALQLGAIDRGLNTPPASPAEGDVYIVGATPTGVWAGQANKVVIRYGGVWRFVPGVDSAGSTIAMGAAQEGITVYVRDENISYVWTGSAWAIAGIDPEVVRDTMASALVAGANVTITANDGADTITIAAAGTDAEVVRDTMASALVAGANVTITANDGADTITIAASTDAEVVRDTMASALVAGANVTITADDAANTITIAATGGGSAIPSTDYYIEDYGGSVTAGFDNTPAFNAILTAIGSGGSGRIIFGRGNYDFMTAPSKIIGMTVRVEGLDSTRSVLRRRYTCATDADGFITAQGASLNSSIANIALIVADGPSGAVTGGHMVGCVATSSAAPDFWRVENVYVSSSGGSTYSYAGYINGDLRTTAPVGCRDLMILNSYLFSGTSGPLYAKSYTGLMIVGAGGYLTNASSKKSVFTGSSSVPGRYLNIACIDFGNISLDYAFYTNINAAVISGNVENTANTYHCRIHGVVEGTRQNNWIKSMYMDFLATSPDDSVVVTQIGSEQIFTLANGKKIDIELAGYNSRIFFALNTGEAISLETPRSAAAFLTSGYSVGASINIGSSVDTKVNIIKPSASNTLTINNRTGFNQGIRMTIFGQVLSISDKTDI